MQQYRHKVHQLQAVTVQHPKIGLMMLYWCVQEGPLYQVLAEYQYDWLLVSKVDEMLYVQGMNIVFHGNIMTADELPFLRPTECLQ